MDIGTHHNHPDFQPKQRRVSLWWSSVRNFSSTWNMDNVTINRQLVITTVYPSLNRLLLNYTSLKPNQRPSLQLPVCQGLMESWELREFIHAWFSSAAKSQDIAEFAKAIGIMSWVASEISPEKKKKTEPNPKIVDFVGGIGVLLGFKCRNSRSIWMSDVY